MKNPHLTLVISVMFGCAVQNADKNVLTVYDLAEKVTHENRDYYVVDLNDLSRVNKPDSLTYVGTIDSYHLLREWSKIKVKEGEIFYFAVPKNSCVVRDEVLPKNERYYFENVFKQYRHVSLENGKCFVPPRKVPPSKGGE